MMLISGGKGFEDCSAFDGIERIHDHRMVRPSELQALRSVESNPGKLAHSVYRILLSGACKQNRSPTVLSGVAENHTGGDHPSRFAVFSVLYLKEAFRWNYAFAFLMIIGAVFFMFKG